jgi:hypothetical protein
MGHAPGERAVVDDGIADPSDPLHAQTLAGHLARGTLRRVGGIEFLDKNVAGETDAAAGEGEAATVGSDGDAPVEARGVDGGDTSWGAAFDREEEDAVGLNGAFAGAAGDEPSGIRHPLHVAPEGSVEQLAFRAAEGRNSEYGGTAALLPPREGDALAVG